MVEKHDQPRLFDTRVQRVEECESEEKTVGTKSFCKRMRCWTTCREVGWCVAEEVGK